jgi:hypothetical protein
MPNLTKDHALLICKKLKAVNESSKGSAHEKFCVYHEGILLGFVGVRHGSKKDQGHGHIPKDLNVSPRFAWEMGTCTKSLEDFLTCMREKNLLPPETLKTDGSVPGLPAQKTLDNTSGKSSI